MAGGMVACGGCSGGGIARGCRFSMIACGAAVITDWFLGLWLDVGAWVLGLLGEYEGLPSGVESAVDGVSSLFGSTGAFFGALNHWFPVPLFLSVAAAGLLVEVGIVLVIGFRKLKQLLPFQ